MQSGKTKGYNSYLIFVTLFYFFLFKDYLERVIPFLGYADELIAISAVPIFFFSQQKNQLILKIAKKSEGYCRYVVLFLLIGIVSSIFFMYQNIWKIALPDAFLCIKFWLTLYVGKHIFIKMDMDKFSHKIYKHIKFMEGLYALLILADWILKIFPTTIRFGIRSTQLMYSHPTVFVACCVFLIMILLSIKEYVTGYMPWLILLLIMMCTTLRSKAMGAALAIVLICYFVFYRKKKFQVRTIILFIPLAILLGWDQIEFYFFSPVQMDSARYQLLIKSIEIAKDCFPFGSGFGTFASYYSSVDYSPLYSMYGLGNVNGLMKGATYFVSDSFWPMVIGQTGFVGLVFYALALWTLFRVIQKLRSISFAYYAAALSGFCYLLIASVAESAFVHPLAMPIAMWLGFLIGQRESLS